MTAQVKPILQLQVNTLNRKGSIKCSVYKMIILLVQK